MRRIRLLAVVVLVAAIVTGCALQSKMSRYIQLAAPEQQPAQALAELDMRAAEQYIFDLINRDRRNAGLPAVNWDETAAAAARGHALEMAQNDYLAHWDLSGQKPQQRYRLAGGMNRTTENAAYARLQGYPISQAVLLQTVEQLQQGMMAEVPPNDGHRKAILDVFHTYVGVGVAAAVRADGALTIAFTQEFTNRYVQLGPLPVSLHTQDSMTVTGRINQPERYQVTSVQLIWEEAPVPQTVDQLKTTHSYSGPDFNQMCSYALPQYPRYYYDHVAAKGGLLRVADGTFAAVLQASNRPGLNYLYVWLRDLKTGQEFPATELVVEVH